MVKVKFGIYEATIQDLEWASSNKPLERWLNGEVPVDGPSGSDPFPDLTLARLMVKRIGGKVIEANQTPHFQVGRVY